MKTKILFISLCLSLTQLLSAQDITGEWNGMLKVGGMQLRLVFHITKTADSYSTTMDSPDQGAKDLPMSMTTFENNVLTVEMAAAGIEYIGKLDSGKVTGNFKQRGQSYPMTFTRKTIEKAEVKRPQEPVKPYPYYSEEVTFENKNANITLAGTLTLPKKEGKFPVVILITGSGPQNRDEELMGHKPFLILSDYLTRNGIGVLRYDDRGTFASKGNFSKSTTFDFATDVESAVNYLKTRPEIDLKHIGLIGHSEGGIIAPMVAVKSKDVSFIVLMAGTGVSGGDLLLRQQEQIGSASGIKAEDLKKSEEINTLAYKIIQNTTDSTKLTNDLKAFIKSKFNEIPGMAVPKGMTEDEMIDSQVALLISPWMLNFIRYNPASTLEKVKCPVLAIDGDKDMQVDSKINLPAIENALKKGGNNKYTIEELPGLNHLFQECKTGLPKEYAEIEQTISPLALTTMTNWIKTIVK